MLIMTLVLEVVRGMRVPVIISASRGQRSKSASELSRVQVQLRRDASAPDLRQVG